MSSGEEFEVDEILEQRRRKGKLEYLIRWKGFGDDYDSWEPESNLAHLGKLLKAFQAKVKRSRSKSRSRSRGRPRSKSSSRSRSRSAGRKTPKKSPTRSSRKAASTGSVVKKEESPDKTSPVKQERRGRSRSRTRAEEKPATSKTEVTTQTSTRRQGSTVQQKSQVVEKKIETVKATPVTTQSSSSMSTRSRLAVRQVQNDQKAEARPGEKEKDLRFWWFADHAILLLFIIVSIIAISFCVESFAELRQTLTPDFGVLRQRLGDMWEHLVQSLSSTYDFLMEVLPGWGSGAGTTEKTASPPPPKSSGGA